MHILFLMLVMVVHGGREKVVLDMRLVTSFFSCRISTHYMIGEIWLVF